VYYVRFRHLARAVIHPKQPVKVVKPFTIASISQTVLEKALRLAANTLYLRQYTQAEHVPDIGTA
jgi:hypothetical protein